MNEISKEVIAEMAYEVNRLWCKLNGDETQLPWGESHIWQQDSVFSGVEFHHDNPDAGGSASHDNWMREKKACGWVYGDVKDADASPPTHPCMVEFNELPLIQQKKDALFRAVVHALS